VLNDQHRCGKAGGQEGQQMSEGANSASRGAHDDQIASEHGPFELSYGLKLLVIDSERHVFRDATPCSHQTHGHPLDGVNLDADGPSRNVEPCLSVPATLNGA
jgi:hypothetical protein